MHIPDGSLNGATCAVTSLIAVAGVAWAARRAAGPSPSVSASERLVPAAGVAACIFAGQMLNYPIGHGVSGHLLGGAMAAILLGPHLGVLVMTAVLLVQCLVFGDGGITALGANVLNLALVPAFCGHALFGWFRRAFRNRGGSPLAAALSGTCTVLLAAVMCGLELTLSGSAASFPLIPALFKAHLPIGLVEGLITALAMGGLAVRSPEGWTPRVARSVGVVALMMVLLGPLASMAPDALELVVGRFSLMTRDPALFPAPFAGYSLNLVGVGWGASVLAGLTGAVLVAGLTRVLTRRMCPAGCTAR